MCLYGCCLWMAVIFFYVMVDRGGLRGTFEKADELKYDRENGIINMQCFATEGQ